MKWNTLTVFTFTFCHLIIGVSFKNSLLNQVSTQTPPDSTVSDVLQSALADGRRETAGEAQWRILMELRGNFTMSFPLPSPGLDGALSITSKSRLLSLFHFVLFLIKSLC